MPVESADDLLVFLSDDFEGGGTVLLNGSRYAGQFLNGFETVSLGGLDIQSNSPLVIARTVDVEKSNLDTISNRAVVANNSTDYLAKTIESDGTGMTIIELIEAT